MAAAEALAIAGVEAGVQLLYGNICGAAKLLLKLGLVARSSKSKCRALASQVEMITDALQSCISTNSDRYDQNANLQRNLHRLLVVVDDCVDLVKKHGDKKWHWSLFSSGITLMADEFDELDSRLKQCMQCLGLSLSISSHDHIEEVLSEVREAKAALSQLVSGEKQAEDCPVPGVVTAGEALHGDYMISGMLETNESSLSPLAVILVQSDETKKEVAILKKLGIHPSILSFIGVFTYVDKPYLVFEKPSQEMATLDDVIKKNTRGFNQDWRLKRMIAVEIAIALDFAHEAGVLHKNLRSTNIFFSEDGQQVKMFGFFQGRIAMNPSAKKFMSNEQVRWVAPEQVQRHRPVFDMRCDIFSLGVVFWELITGSFPFSGYTNYRELTNARSSDSAHLEGFTGAYVEGEVGKFSKISLQCRDPNPTNRPSLQSTITALRSLLPEEMQV